MRPVVALLVLWVGCDSPSQPVCQRPELSSLDSAEGPRRHGCLDPARVPEWAAVARIDDADTLARLVAPFDVGEGRWLKFVVERTAEPRWTWFVDGSVFGPHWEFTRAIGCESDVHEFRVLGEVGIFTDQLDERGEPGRFYFSIDGNPPADFDVVSLTYELLRQRIPIAAGLTYVPGDDAQRDAYEAERDRFDVAPFEVALSPSSNPDEGIAALHEGVGYGWLRRVAPTEIPATTDIPVYDTLPNDLPRVAGIITTTPQAGLAHVNLRAAQDGVPNVYVPEALAPTLVEPFLDQWVRIEVRGLELEIRAASQDEVEAHFVERRPRRIRRPSVDRSVDTIRSFAEIGFGDADAVGTKAANLAELHRAGLDAFVPDGVAVPLGFYIRFMEGTGLDQVVDALLDDPRFHDDRARRREQLAELRERIERASMPLDLAEALGVAHERWPEGTSLRCRSSTNAEDLEDFSGAGLYESYTHHPDEGHLSKSIQQVYASLWTERAWEQREFHRIDHRRVAMGVAIHPNFDNERVNGVAVSDDVLYRWREGLYYVNAQVGEDLVTNPEPGSIPEELYLTPDNPRMSHFVIRRSSVAEGEPLMTDDQLDMLSRDLARIHAHFAALYRPSDRFAMEIELKITAEGQLAIKQARPWVYASSAGECR